MGHARKGDYMINRFRNVPMAAFIPMLSTATVFVCCIWQGRRNSGSEPPSDAIVDKSDANEIRARIIIYGYALWVLIQYVVWKEPVFLPWKFKVDEE